MKFISAGHNPKGPNPDPGAVANGYREADLTIDLRDRVLKVLASKKQTYIRDLDTETLGEYLHRIVTGDGSVVCEFHFNAGPASANGIEVLVQSKEDRNELTLAQAILEAGKAIGLKSRGIKTEKDSHHTTLGLMKEKGIVVLVEVCFITSKEDLDKYFANRDKFAAAVTEALIVADNAIK